MPIQSQPDIGMTQTHYADSEPIRRRHDPTHYPDSEPTRHRHDSTHYPD